MKKKILIITHEINELGGVTSMIMNVLNFYKLKNKYEIDILSVSSSFKINFKSILRNKNFFFNHKLYEYQPGFSFIEIFRYKKSKILDDFFSNYDELNVITGVPIWSNFTLNFKKKIKIWFATSIYQDRKDRIKANKILYIIHLINLKFLEWFEKKTIEIIQLKKNIHIFSLSNYSRSLYLNISSKIITLYPFFKIKKCKNIKTKRQILHVSRFNDPRKNIFLLLKFFQILITKKRNYKLILIGDKPNKKITQFISANNLMNHIKVIPFISQNKLIRYYEDSEYFLLTSKEEGLAYVVLEAMSHGCIPISSKCGGPEDIITNNLNGFLYENNDINGLLKIFFYLENNKDLNFKIQNNIYLSLKDNFSIQNFSKIFD